MFIKLNEEQKNTLFIEDHGSGGFQSLMRRLQDSFDENSYTIKVDKDLLERILKYSHDYKNGGWQSRLERIFDL